MRSRLFNHFRSLVWRDSGIRSRKARCIDLRGSQLAPHKKIPCGGSDASSSFLQCVLARNASGRRPSFLGTAYPSVHTTCVGSRRLPSWTCGRPKRRRGKPECSSPCVPCHLPGQSSQTLVLQAVSWVGRRVAFHLLTRRLFCCTVFAVMRIKSNEPQSFPESASGEKKINFSRPHSS